MLNIEKTKVRYLSTLFVTIVSLLLKEEVKDFDIYFRNKEVTEKVAEYYVSKFNNTYKNKTKAIVNTLPDKIKIVIKSDGVVSENENVLKEPFEDIFNVADDLSASLLDDEIEKEEKYRPIFLSSNAITLSDKIQLIVRFYGEPDDIHSTYDFVLGWLKWLIFIEFKRRNKI